jgi:hypothetical protein
LEGAEDVLVAGGEQAGEPEVERGQAHEAAPAAGNVVAGGVLDGGEGALGGGAPVVGDVSFNLAPELAYSTSGAAGPRHTGPASPHLHGMHRSCKKVPLGALSVSSINVLGAAMVRSSIEEAGAVP